MFTGLVEAVGTVEDREPMKGGVRLTVASELAANLADGDSVAVDGACLTITGAAKGRFRVQAMETTLSKTTLGGLETGRRVNLERALRAGDRLGGHLVQGHVDGVGTVSAVEPAEASVVVRVDLPAGVARTTVPHGSLTVDGVSLTVADLDGPVAEIAIIPYTWDHTTLDRLRPGCRVNLEADVLGKYVGELLRPYLDLLDARTGEGKILE